MASPQLEDGHTQIANELMDAFCRCFPGGSVAQTLLAILRQTYGWHKKEDTISISQLSKMTTLSRRAVIYAIQNLEAMRMITVKRLRGRGNKNLINTIALQKNYELWMVQRISPQYQKQLQKQCEKYKRQVVQRIGGSAKNANKVVQRIENHEEQKSEFFAPTKDTNIQKKLYKRKYGQFQNVLLTDDEYSKLQIRFGERIADLIEELSLGIESKGYKYKSHYAAILSWQRRASGQVSHSRQIPKTYTPQRDYGD